jgi:hypothetical protein
LSWPVKMAHAGGRISLPSLRDLKDKLRGTLQAAVRVPSGIYKAVFHGVRTGATKRFNDWLEGKEGSTPVAAIRLTRKPVFRTIQQIADWVSFGSWSRMKSHLQYDDVYHNALLFTLADNSKWKVEKNHVAEYSVATGADYSVDGVDIILPTDRQLTLKEMVAKASAYDPQAFWQYDARNQNCQRFTYDMLSGNGLNGPELYLKPQDAEALVSSLGFLHGIPKQVTDLAGRADRAIYGDGIHRFNGRRLVIRAGRARLFPQ